MPPRTNKEYYEDYYDRRYEYADYDLDEVKQKDDIPSLQKQTQEKLEQIEKEIEAENKRFRKFKMIASEL